MPDIIEENEGEGNSAIQRRANALVLARAAAAAAAAAPNNNNNINAAAVAVAVPEGNAPAAPPAAAGAAAAAAANGNNNNNEAAEVTQVAAHLARLAGVDVRPMFRRLGVRRVLDCKYIREKDLDGIPRITPIQKRKVWAILKYVATDNPPLKARTTLSEIAKTLNANKKKEKENAAAANSSTTTTTTAAATTASVMPLVQISKLDAFDGSHSKWLLWKNKAYYSLAQSNLRPLLQEGDEGKTHAKKYPSQDYLLFNFLAEAIVSGSASHLIYKAEQQTQQAQGNTNNSSSKKTNPSGRLLWQMLVEEYSKGPMAFYILSDARKTLQLLHLVSASSSSSSSSSSIQETKYDDDNNNNSQAFITCSAQDYVNRFRSAQQTLAEYKQALPDAFLASTFVEHIYDDKLESIKKQLLHDVSTKNLSLEECIKELLMSDHMLRVRRQDNNVRASRKRNRPDEPDPGDEDGKRLRMEQDQNNNGDKDNLNDEPDEAMS